MNSKTVRVIISLAVALGFLLLVFRRPAAFHLLPFVIHQSFFRNVIDESTFIDIFDILFSIGLCFLVMFFLRD